MRRFFRIREYDSDSDGDVRDEIEAHLELEVERLKSLGLEDAAARRGAEARFGDRVRFEAEARREASARARRVRWRMHVESLAQDVRHGLRRLKRSPGFTVVALLTLSVGIGAVSTLFTMVHSVLLSPLPFADPEALVFAWETRQEGSVLAPVSPLNFREWRAANAGLAAMAAVRAWPYNVTGRELPERVNGAQVSAGLLSLLGVDPHLGREFTRDEETLGAERVCMVSHGYWLSRLGGNPDLASIHLVLNGESYAVVGVLPEGFSIPGSNPRPILTPLPLDPDQPGFWSNHNALVIGRLLEGVPIARAGEAMEAVAARLEGAYPDWNKGIGARLVPARDQVVQGAQRNLWVLFGSVAFVLLIACVNIGGLFLARAMASEHEVAVRSALGAHRSRVLRLVLSEALILGAAGGLLGFWICHICIDAIPQWAPGDLPRLAEISVSFPVVFFVFALSLGTAVLFGLLPALHASRVTPQSVLKESGRGLGGRGRQRIQRLLVAGEVAVAVLLLVGSGLLLRTLWNLMEVDPGFAMEGRAALHVSLAASSYPDRESVTTFLARVHEEIDATPGVQASASSVGMPFQGLAWRKQMTVEGQPAATLPEVPVVDLSIVTPGWLETLGIPLLRGRALRETDRAGVPFVALVNEAFVRMHSPDRDPVGRRIRFAPPDDLLPAGQEAGFPWYTIVGVVGDVRRWGLSVEATPEVFIHQQQDMDVAREFFVVAHTSLPPTALAEPLRDAVRVANPDQPVTMVRTMDSMYEAAMARQRFNAFLVVAFGVAALFLAVTGVYGLMANAVSRRRWEIGLRVALGAHPIEVVRQAARDGLLASLAGIVLGLALAAALGGLIGSLLFGVEPLDAVTYVSVAGLVLAAALTAATVPSLRAARTDPTLTLRRE